MLSDLSATRATRLPEHPKSKPADNHPNVEVRSRIRLIMLRVQDRQIGTNVKTDSSPPAREWGLKAPHMW